MAYKTGFRFPTPFTSLIVALYLRFNVIFPTKGAQDSFETT